MQRILVVEDDSTTRVRLRSRLERDGFRVETAEDGLEAWERVREVGEKIDAVLLDLELPRMSGFEFLRTIKAHPELQAVPVVVLTCHSDPDTVVDGIESGAYYYLTKPIDEGMLVSIIRAASAKQGRYRELQLEVRQGVGAMRLMRRADFKFRSLEEASNLATVLARACPDPEQAVMGLTELLVNAVEHGNLGISYEEKSALARAEQWHEEVQRRLTAAENRSKYVRVRFERFDDRIRVHIADEGSGFDWRSFLRIDPGRAFHTHGRGIAIANLVSFDSVEYLGAGNEVVATIWLNAETSAVATVSS